MSKIIFINRYYAPDISATSQMLTDLSVSLVRKGYAVVVVTSRQRYQDPSADLAPAEEHEGVKIRRVWTTSFGRTNLAGRMLDYISFYLTSLWALYRVTSPGDVVVAKTDPPLISSVAWLIARVRRAVLVNWIQDLFPEVASVLGIISHRLVIAPLVVMRNASLRTAAVNVVIGEHMKERLLSLSIPPNNIEVIPNWAKGDELRPVDAASNRLRADWGLHDKFVVGYSGNMGRAHDFSAVIEAMKILKDESDVIFLFIGNGKAREEIQGVLESSGLTNFLFKPYQPREMLSESLSVPDLHLVSLLPSMEGLILPSKIYGICAAGRAAAFIGDTNGEIALLIGQCDCGFSVPVGDGRALADGIRSCRDDADSTRVRGRNARACFEEKYDLPIAVGSWEKVLSRVGAQ